MMARGEIRKRQKNTVELRKTVVIVCEGEKTERHYFAQFKARLRGRLKIELPDTNVTNPVKLVSQAKAMIDRYDLRIKDGDRLYVVFDADQNTQAQLDRAGSIARSVQAGIGFSNPCFELSYQLHFERPGTDLTAKDTFKRLLHYTPGYTKAGLPPPELSDKMLKAIQNAKILNERPELRGFPVLHLKANPCCNIGEIVNYLLGESEIGAKLS